MSSGRIKVTRGEDYLMVLKLRDKTANDPVNLTNASKVAIEFTLSNRAILVLTNELRPAQKASVKIQSTVIRALQAGDAGNSVILMFDSSKTVRQAVIDWNATNPTLLIEAVGDDLIKPVTGTYRLDAGFDTYYPIQIVGSPLLGRITVKLNDFDTRGLRLGLNQTLEVKVDIGPYPSGSRIIARFENKFDVID